MQLFQKPGKNISFISWWPQHLHNYALLIAHLLTTWSTCLAHSALTFLSHQVALISWERTSHPRCRTRGWAPVPRPPASVWGAAVGTSHRWPRRWRIQTQLLKRMRRQTSSLSFWQPGSEGSGDRALALGWSFEGNVIHLKPLRWKTEPVAVAKPSFLL